MTRRETSSSPHSALQKSRRHVEERLKVVSQDNSAHPSYPPSPTFPSFEELPLPNLIKHLDPTTFWGKHLIFQRAKELEKEEMADPFEVRMRFTSQLQHLNASVTSAQKAAHYALKHREMDEDLHSCILEQLERVSQSTFHPLDSALVTNIMSNTEQHEQQSKYHVLFRSTLRPRTPRSPSRIHPHDGTRHPTNNRPGRSR